MPDASVFQGNHKTDMEANSSEEKEARSYRKATTKKDRSTIVTQFDY